MLQSGYNIRDIVQEAQFRWLKPPEILFILQNYEYHTLTEKPPQKPASGSLFLFNKRVLRFFRKDGHSWRKKKDGRTVGEAHERLKVGNAEVLNCYYAHGDLNPNFQRRSYWMLDPAYEHIVLVHYRDITEGRQSGGSSLLLSPGSYSTLTQSPSLYTNQTPGFTAGVTEFLGPYQSISSPGSVEVSSDVVIKNDSIDHVDVVERIGEVDDSTELEINEALRRLEQQLSLGDGSLKGTGSFCHVNENSNCADIIHHQSSISSAGMQGNEKEDYFQPLFEGFSTIEEAAWDEMLGSFNISADVGSQERHVYTSNENATPLPPSSMELVQQQESSQWINNGGSNANNSSVMLLQEVDDLNFAACSPSISTYGANSDHYMAILEQGPVGLPLEESSSLTVSQKQKFTIHEISPEWGYAHEATKLIIVGSFLCDISDCVWSCMFGDTEVPIQIIKEGVMRCHAPPHLPGKVTLCITSGNRESCSEVREFEYRVNPSNWADSNFPETEASKNSEELLLLVRLVQMLLSDPLMQQSESSKSEVDLLDKVKAAEDSWNQVIEALSIGTSTPSSTTDWLLQELLKDKLQQWLSSRLHKGTDLEGSSLSKSEQGMIHMVAGLGYVWALNPILSSGVNVDFRDINGLTALHWAARFGREKMVAALIASGASAGAVTDPTSQDSTGKTPASIAAAHGHKGLAGYLSEVSLTSHLSNLKISESELSKTIADVEAERTVNSISNTSPISSEDQLSLKDTLAAVRNSAQAAARIQAAFRAHSFKRKQQKEAAAFITAVHGGDEYSFLSNDILGLSAASKLAFRNSRDSNAAALSIQKKYRGWKGRKDFLDVRQKVVKIQAHVRGHQVRKNYKVICWAVSVLEKVVLRWRRRGIGLRGFRLESESIDEGEDEDIMKVFRKQKVDVAIDEAVSRVLSMVESLEARQQYRRMLEKYRQAKAELGVRASEAAIPSTSQADLSIIENDVIY